MKNISYNSPTFEKQPPRHAWDLPAPHSFQPEDTEILGKYVDDTPSGEPPELINILLGHVQVLMDAGILLAYDAVLAAESGDAGRTYDHLTASLRVVQHLQDEPFLISGIFSLWVERTLLEATEGILRDYPELFSDEQLASLAHCMAAIDPPIDNWFESERLMMLDVMQRIYGKSGRITHQGALYLGLSQSGDPFESYRRAHERELRAQRMLVGIGLPAINQLVASRDEQLAMYNEIMTARAGPIARHRFGNSPTKKADSTDSPALDGAK